jgi:hypothetical protein
MSVGNLIGLVIAALAIVGIVWWALARRHRTELLQAQYGDEYDRTVGQASSTREAEAELVKRQKRVEQFAIHPLSAEQRASFGHRWHDVQEMFVDDPGRAATQADDLVAEVMRVRGYPVTDFEQRASDVSVHHSVFVKNYRDARDVAERNRQGAATTEELRRAVVYYRELFEDLLEPDEVLGERPVRREVESEVSASRDRTPESARERVQRPIAPPRTDRGGEAR